MGVWLMMLGFNVLIPLLMIIGGVCMRKIKNINSIVGYRTMRSMRSEEAWLFANRYCGRLWIKTGIIMLICLISIFIPLCFADEKIMAIFGCALMFIQFLPLFISIYFVERAMKNFDGKSEREDEKY